MWPLESAVGEPLCVVVGAGPGNGAALGRRFARAGRRVALLARDVGRLESLAAEIPGSAAIGCDATDPDSIAQAFARIAALGLVDTLIYNAGNYVLGSVRDTDPGVLETAFAINCTGCLRSVQHVLPAMIERAAGAIVVIGATASRRGAAHTLPFATAKAGQRIMAESMARTLGPLGIHVAYVVIDGAIDTPVMRALLPTQADDFFLRADDIAEAVFQLTQQARSAWSFELDLRPYTEHW